MSFLYIAFSEEHFILPFNHNDCEKLEIDLSTSNQIKYCWNKKGLLQSNININNLKDVQSSLFFNKNELYPFYEKIEVLTNFYHRLGIRDDLGKTIPIMKFIEVLSGIIDDWVDLEPCLPWIDDTMIPILSDIERLGIQADRENFLIDAF